MPNELFPRKSLLGFWGSLSCSARDTELYLSVYQLSQTVHIDFCMVAYFLSQSSLLHEVSLESPSYHHTSNI